MEEEIWKDIPGYEGKYQASTLGKIKSLDRMVKYENHRTGSAYCRPMKGRILKPGTFCKSGHVSVVLGHGKNGSPVHQLVMKTFVGHPPKGMEVLHINGNPKDNRLSNLRYGTRTENILDVYWQGKKWRKLGIDDVEEIRFAMYCGWSGKEIAGKFHVSETTISRIKCGRAYKWL